MSITAQQVHLLRRPDGLAHPSDFQVVDVRLPDLNKGQVLIENLWMSIDPYMRRSMDADATDLPPWPLNHPLDGPSVGRVIASENPRFSPGDIVESMSGWQSHFISNGGDFIPYLSPNDSLALRPALAARPQDCLGLLGVAALTAYRGMVCLARCAPQETAVISSGAGTVGSIACQIGKIQGLRVVSSAGTDEKVRWLEAVAGVDRAFNYRKVDIAQALADACPRGIDLLLESASPEHFCACLPLMNELKQILICGFVSVYSTGGKVEGIKNFHHVLDKFLTIQSYRFMDSLDAYDRFAADMLRWREEGRLTLPEVVYQGLQSAPLALCDLFTGGKLGKSLVRLDH